jgi:hypothetical protein
MAGEFQYLVRSVSQLMGEWVAGRVILEAISLAGLPWKA